MKFFEMKSKAKNETKSETKNEPKVQVKKESKKSLVTKNEVADDNKTKKGKKEVAANKDEKVNREVTEVKTVSEKVENELAMPLENEEKTEGPSFFTKFTYKPIVNKKLTILLLENTAEVDKEKENILKIVKKLVSSGLLIIISYGNNVKVSQTFDISTFENIEFEYNGSTDNKACLYDALVELEGVVNKMYMKIEEGEKEKVMVNNIDVVGIGTCKDNYSLVSKEQGINYFYTVTRKRDVITKYFCLTEESFIKAAEIGFHSIAAISRSYQ